MLYGLPTRKMFYKSTCFNQNSLMTVTRTLRLFHTTSLCHKNYSKSWLAKASNVIYRRGETLFKTYYKRTIGLVEAFDDLLGITEVQEAQSSVKKAENDFMTTRGQVQAAKTALDSVQERLREVRRKLDRVPRYDERYLALATEEHKILVEEKKMKTQHESWEALERDQFALLSGAVRDSHEKERLRAERTKHWSVIGSIGGAALGILGSTVVNYIRLKQIKNSIKETGITLIEKTGELTDLVKSQDDEVRIQATELKEFFSTQNELLEQKLEELGHVLNFVTLNLASEPFKEFGIHFQRPGARKTFDSGQTASAANHTLQGDIKGVIVSIASKIDSIIAGMKINQKKMEDDFRALQLNLEKMESTVLQKEKSTAGMELMDLDRFNNNQTLPACGVKEAVVNEYFNQSYWWMKANTCTTVICTVLTATILIYEIIK